MKDEDSLQSLLQSLEARLLQPDVRKSSHEFSNLLADNFMEYGSSGRTYNKQQVLKTLQKESAIYRSITDFHALVLAQGVVLVTYRTVRQDASGESPSHSLHSSIWKWIDTRWQMIFHQGTLTKERRNDRTGSISAKDSAAKRK